jgi:hypothetical protein
MWQNHSVLKSNKYMPRGHGEGVPGAIEASDIDEVDAAECLLRNTK